MEHKLNIVVGLWNGPCMMGAYYEKALRSVANVYTVGPSVGRQSDFDCQPNDPIEPILAQIPESIDFYIQFYSKPDYFPPDLYKIKIPKVWYLYDLHLHFDVLATSAYLFDMVLTYDENSREKLLEYGLRNVEILPFAADKGLYYRDQNNHGVKKYDVGFAGSVSGHPTLKGRRELLDRVGKKCNLKIEDRTLVGSAVADFYQDCKVVINHAVSNDLNMRISEVLMSGRPLLTPYVDGLEKYLDDGVHAKVFNDDNLDDKLEELLNNETEREEMAKRGQQLALEKYNYDVCANKMIEYLGNYLKDHNAPQNKNMKKDPWLCASAQFRYHWFRFRGDALNWLRVYVKNNEQSVLRHFLIFALVLLTTTFHVLEKCGRGPYFQKKS